MKSTRIFLPHASVLLGIVAGFAVSSVFAVAEQNGYNKLMFTEHGTAFIIFGILVRIEIFAVSCIPIQHVYLKRDLN
ncbi:MAG: hypothetical protein U0M95_05280 [Ruminococcus sp.]